jgi:hypothetical protein
VEQAQAASEAASEAEGLTRWRRYVLALRFIFA